jgi:D-amino peptidase
MRIFISFDMEGVAGIVDWSQCRAPGQPYEEGRALLLGEVNAAIDGALAGGATEIVCNDSHGAMNNLNPADLHGRASSIAGRHKPLYMMEGLDPSFGAVFFVGYHGSISGPSSVLSHTYNPSVIARATLNGLECGESGINALAALGHRVPIALISGDQVALAEAAPFAPGVEQVQVKESITRFAAAQVHPEEARERIRAGAEAAARPGDPDRRHGAGGQLGQGRRADGHALPADRGRGPARDLPVVRGGHLHHPGVRGTVGDRLRPVLLAALAGADRPQPPLLRLVQRQVARDRDRGGNGDDRDPRPDGPRGENDQEDQAENDPGYPDLQAWCHDDSIRPELSRPVTSSLAVNPEVDPRADLVAGRR